MFIADIFLVILALVWIVYASVSDLKKREVPNWIPFSLIALSLVYRAFFSIINSQLGYFLWGLFGLCVFIGLGYGLYYARVFAGGDAKLFMSLGAILPFSSSLFSNLLIFGAFVFLLLLFGGIWGLIFTIGIVLKNKKKFSTGFGEQIKDNKKIIYISLIFVFLFLIFSYFDIIFVSFAIMIALFPFLYFYAKAIEENCMIKTVLARNLVEGDWLYEKIKVGSKIIKPYWEGLSEEEVSLLKKSNRKIKVKEGIPFVPGFFFAFLALIYLWNFSIGFGSFA